MRTVILSPIASWRFSQNRYSEKLSQVRAETESVSPGHSSWSCFPVLWRFCYRLVVALWLALNPINRRREQTESICARDANRFTVDQKLKSELCHGTALRALVISQDASRNAIDSVDGLWILPAPLFMDDWRTRFSGA